MDTRKRGKGAYGRVYAIRVGRTADTKTVVAIKAGSASNESEYECLWAIRQARIPHTIYALAAMRNAGPPMLTDPCELAIAMTHVQGVTLREYLAARSLVGQPISYALIVHWMAQMVDFLLHLQVRLGFSHDDIKLGNIMVEETCSTKPLLRVVDFTFAGRNPTGGRAGRPAEEDWQRGTVCYMAPERLFLEKRPSWATSEGPDVWAMGTLLSTLVLNAQPMEGILKPDDVFRLADVNGRFHPQHTDTIYHVLSSTEPWLVEAVTALSKESGLDAEVVEQAIRLLLWTRARMGTTPQQGFGLPVSSAKCMPGLSDSPLYKLIDKYTGRIVAAYDRAGSTVYERVFQRMHELMGPKLYALWRGTQHWDPQSRGRLADLHATLNIFPAVMVVKYSVVPAPRPHNDLPSFLAALEHDKQ
jgi:serine/threonine protein kinase